MVRSAQQVVLEEVTPARAEQFLKRNARNRQVSEDLVRKYASDMQGGRWLPTGDSIKFDKAGNLIDGQHRLEAVKQSGMVIGFVVVRNLEADAQMVIDTGRPRRVFDNLKMLGFTDHATVSATVSEIYRWENGLYAARQGSKFGPTTLQALDVLDRHPDLLPWTRKARAGYLTFRGLPASLGASLGYVFNAINPAEAEWFFERFWSGTNLSEGNPVLALRNVTGNAMLREGRRPPTPYYRAITIKAWNAHLEGRNYRHLTWKAGEVFPLPIGIEGVPWVKLYNANEDGQLGLPGLPAAAKKPRRRRTTAEEAHSPR